MRLKKLSGSERLVPTRPSGLQYQVQYGIHLLEEIPRPGRRLQSTRWAKCSLRFAHAQRIPDGSYCLHAEDGRGHQLRFGDREWRYLAVTVRPPFALSAVPHHPIK